MSADFTLDPAISHDPEDPEYSSRNGKPTLKRRDSLVFKILDGFLEQRNRSFINIATNAVRRVTSKRFSGETREGHSDDSSLPTNGDGRWEHGSEKKSGPLLSGTAYCISSCSMILLNKVVLSSYGFDAGISLMFYQCHCCYGVETFGLVSTEKLTWKLIKVWIPVNIIFIGMLVTGMYSLKYINIAMVTILKNLTNILTAIGELYIFKKRQNRKVWTAMLMMIISALTSGITDISFDAVGYTWQIFNCILTASYSLTLRRVMDTAKQTTRSGSLNEVTMVLLNNALSLPLAIFLIIIFNEWEYVYTVDVVRLPMFWVVATASGLLGLSISFTSMWFLNQTGPTTYSLVGSLNKIPISIAGLLLFNVSLSLSNLFSILFGLFAGVLFARAKMS
ncbi:hypothetical protein MKW92_014920 [Papaver armeniacum]|nr:hypothetical protein MKW92_014920 [Papaver armeniacum]